MRDILTLIVGICFVGIGAYLLVYQIGHPSDFGSVKLVLASVVTLCGLVATWASIRLLRWPK